ncbi:hypothetical protein SDC9_159432 [bioreactor metagenome]|uniref:Uncharacterized protein n=1 Tax=bioreactor metagenome TaxID=1076179 RepID=A0A645FDT2_9ZZZZ
MHINIGQLKTLRLHNRHCDLQAVAHSGAVTCNARNIHRNIVAAGVRYRAGHQTKRHRFGGFCRKLAHIVVVIAGHHRDFLRQLQRNLHHIQSVGACGCQNFGAQIKFRARLHFAGAIRRAFYDQRAVFTAIGSGRTHALADCL